MKMSNKQIEDRIDEAFLQRDTETLEAVKKELEDECYDNLASHVSHIITALMLLGWS